MYDVKPEKRRTRCPSAKSFGMSLSRSMNFPEPKTRCSPGSNGSGSEFGSKYGLPVRTRKEVGKILVTNFSQLYEEIHEFLPCVRFNVCGSHSFSCNHRFKFSLQTSSFGDDFVYFFFRRWVPFNCVCSSLDNLAQCTSIQSCNHPFVPKSFVRIHQIDGRKYR